MCEPVLQTNGSRSVTRKLPHPLTSLHKHEYKKLEKGELEALCEEKFAKGIMLITHDEAAYLEESTRLQAQSLLWFEHRIGRLTASKFLAVSRASLDPPPASLVKEIMVRSNVSGFVPALQWGTDNEDKAREAYVELASEEHENFRFMPAGLHVNPCYPHLGATPDGLICCDCCGEGIIEIKCPYKHRHIHPSTVTDPTFYLKMCEDGCRQLCRGHAYYHQIQGQLAVCEKQYCDFICWTPLGMHTECILPEPSYLSKTKPSLDAFFVKVVLPLLLTGCTSISNEGRQGSSHSLLDTNSTETVPSTCTSNGNSTCPPHFPVPTYCWCGGGESGRMIACDNPCCTVEWFHFECAGLRRKPRGKWFCSDSCRSDCQQLNVKS